MCAEVGVAEKVKGIFSNRWMSEVSIIGTLTEVVESVNGELTIDCMLSKWHTPTRYVAGRETS